MLKLININAGYDDLKVLQDLSIEVNDGEVVALVGSNGAGKTTMLRVISGFVPVKSGTILWYDKDITNLPAYKRAELGIAHILQGRGILSTLSVRDNLILGSYTKRSKAMRTDKMAEVIQLFPILKERINNQASSLSGGQQQMLAIARALMMNPKLMILDEPSLGLAPILVDEVFRIIENLENKGVSILLIEQNITKALRIAKRGYVMNTGRIEMQGDSQLILNNPEVKKAYLGI